MWAGESWSSLVRFSKHLAVAAVVALGGGIAGPGIAAAGAGPSWVVQSTPESRRPSGQHPAGGVLSVRQGLHRGRALRQEEVRGGANPRRALLMTATAHPES